MFKVQNNFFYKKFLLILQISRFARDQIDLCLLNSLSTFAIEMMKSTKYLKNPYVRSKLAEILYEMTPDASHTSILANRFTNIFETNKVALENLIPALIHLYNDIETTGSKF